MTMNGMGPHGRATRRLVLIVGPESAARDELASSLIEMGEAAIVCSGPPGCVLLREERCVLVDKADATVIMPTHTASREVRAMLTLCAGGARSPIIVEPSVIDLGSRATEVAGGDAASLVDAVRRALGPSSPRRGVADVTDVWL